MRGCVSTNGFTSLCAEFKTVPSRKLWRPSFPAAQAVAEHGVIVPCPTREAIPQSVGAAELVLGDQGVVVCRAGICCYSCKSLRFGGGAPEDTACS
ncbi:hypothetical protein DENSPDRAFT_806307 [Dentipellis sp. KUC8613]|nr:hypothetical protein DENSPDRAFT_806307 [Dentipellis sp. KUC8613]